MSRDTAHVPLKLARLSLKNSRAVAANAELHGCDSFFFFNGPTGEESFPVVPPLIKRPEMIGIRRIKTYACICIKKRRKNFDFVYTIFKHSLLYLRSGFLSLYFIGQ